MFAAALACAAELEAWSVVIDLLGVEVFSLEAASALLSYRRAAGVAVPAHRRLVLLPSPAVTRKLDLLGLTAVLFGFTASAV
ncbi:hypothetical protein [Nocardia sp. NRRL S-836]|uniref:hypothetical protein n=1 Tax=Nocardia sp. NRRL S-836 TaxID=1519492 RepID=UPI0012FAE247|nr:hypothetical protein [Nocardia sp. NRRL S-836]